MNSETSMLPVLIVLIPLVGGVLAPIIGRGIFGWLLALVTTGAATFVSGTLLLYIHAQNTLTPPFAISYPLGGWPAPHGIELKIDLRIEIDLKIDLLQLFIIYFLVRKIQTRQNQ